MENSYTGKIITALFTIILYTGKLNLYHYFLFIPFDLLLRQFKYNRECFHLSEKTYGLRKGSGCQMNH